MRNEIENGMGFAGLVSSRHELSTQRDAEREFRDSYKALLHFAKEYRDWRNAPLKGTGHAEFISQLDKMALSALIKAGEYPQLKA